jgi:hypothetical protein
LFIAVERSFARLVALYIAVYERSCIQLSFGKVEIGGAYFTFSCVDDI